MVMPHFLPPGSYGRASSSFTRDAYSQQETLSYCFIYQRISPKAVLTQHRRGRLGKAFSCMVEYRPITQHPLFRQSHKVYSRKLLFTLSAAYVLGPVLTADPSPEKRFQPDILLHVIDMHS
jgi:hypothetical protein